MLEKDTPKEGGEIITSVKKAASKQPDQNHAELPVVILAKKFAIDGALLPEIQKELIADRTVKRARLKELRKQSNIENIMKKTLGYCARAEVGQKTDHDWFSRYISLCEDISNPTMQDLWAKILAGELIKPGSFSFKTLQVFKDMSIFDAKLLAKASSLALKEPNKKSIRLVSGIYQKPGLLNYFSKDRHHHCNLAQFGVNYADLLSLADNNLIYLQESESSLINKGDVLQFSYNGEPLKLTAKKSDISIQFYKFTAIGAELLHLIGDKGNAEFFEHLKDKLRHSFIVSSGKT